MASPAIIVTDEMVHAALKVLHPVAYREHLRHPSNGPGTAERVESEISTVREMLKAALSCTQAGSASINAPTAAALKPNHCGKFMTVVYRDVKPGEESRLIGEHPKVTALSWSHALNDRDNAIAYAEKLRNAS